MRIVRYKTMLDEDRKNILVRESSKNYPDLGGLDSPDSVCLLANSVFDANRLAEEHGWLIGVNVKNHPIGVFEISHGSDCAAVVTPREIFIRLLLCGAHVFEDRYMIDDRYLPDVYTITTYIQEDLISIISDLYDLQKITSIQFDIHEIR